MAKYFETVDAVKKHLVKAVYRTVPSHSGTKLPKWKLVGGNDSVTKAKGLKTRLFSVEESTDASELVFSGSGVEDYDVTIEIDIAYQNTDNLNTVARGDYTQIKGEVLGSTNIQILDTGFNCFTFQDSILDDADDDEYRIMTIPIVTRISVGLESTIEEWNIGDQGIDVRFI
jgi:hypothetical protein